METVCETYISLLEFNMLAKFHIALVHYVYMQQSKGCLESLASRIHVCFFFFLSFSILCWFDVL